MRRTAWLATGVALGATGTLWAEQRLRRGVRRAAARLAPDSMVHETIEGARRFGDRLSEAMAAGRRARAEREGELWEELARPGPAPSGGPRTAVAGSRGGVDPPVGSPGWTPTR